MKWLKWNYRDILAFRWDFRTRLKCIHISKTPATMATIIIHPLSEPRYPLEGDGRAGAYPSNLRAVSMVHPELVSSQSQGTHKQQWFAHTITPRGNSFCHVGENPRRQREKQMQTTHRSRDSKRRRLYCEANMLTFRPPWCHRNNNHSVKWTSPPQKWSPF